MVDDPPNDITVVGGGSLAANEFVANGTLVGTVVGQDPDSTAFIYSLVDNAGGRFTINASTGAITVANGLLLDFEQNPTHVIRVRVEDQALGAFEKDFTVTINNVDPENIIGDTTANTFVGGPLNDVLSGAGGFDTLLGGQGNDTLTGGAGVDLLYGEGGDDIIQADLDADFVFGGAGNDQITSGATNAIQADGEGGDDTITTGSGVDYLWGGAGNDTISGGGSGDLIDGGLDNDTINGGEGIDYLYGGDGNDTINGGATADLITGMAGNDTLLGGTGSDFLYGESGTDTFDLRQDVNAGDFDYIADLAAGETIVVPIGSVISYSQFGGDVIFSIGSYSVWVDGGATPLTIAQVQAQTLFV